DERLAARGREVPRRDGRDRDADHALKDWHRAADQEPFPRPRPHARAKPGLTVFICCNGSRRVSPRVPLSAHAWRLAWMAAFAAMTDIVCRAAGPNAMSCRRRPAPTQASARATVKVVPARTLFRFELEARDVDAHGG